MVIIVVGDELKWLSHYGPFKTRKEAMKWAGDREFRSPWEIVDLLSPATYDPREE